MTRGKRRGVPSTQNQKSGSKRQGSKRSAPSAAKRAKTVQAINEAKVAHLNRLARSPFVAGKKNGLVWRPDPKRHKPFLWDRVYPSLH